MVVIRCNRCGREIKCVELNPSESANVVQGIGWIISRHKWYCNQCQEKKSVREAAHKGQKQDEKEHYLPQRKVAVGAKKKVKARRKRAV